MPVIAVNGHRLHYRLEGPDTAPVVLFSNSLGTNLSMWDLQVDALAAHFRVLRYDTRGHGSSEVTPGPYSMELLGRDVLGLVDALAIDSFAFCGLSMGGLIGQWLAVHAGPRLQKLVLANTAARIGTRENWDARIAAVTQNGMQALADNIITRWFTPAFAQRSPQQVGKVYQPLLATDPQGYVANCAAVRDADFREQLHLISTPLEFIAGTFDPVTTVADGQYVVERVAGARLRALPAAHLSNIEAAAEFNVALIKFLESHHD